MATAPACMCVQEMLQAVEQQVGSKADVRSLAAAEASTAARLASIEGALLKGLKAVSEKAAAALAAKMATEVRALASVNHPTFSLLRSLLSPSQHKRELDASSAGAVGRSPA
jgi:hypothetical protein